MRSLYSLLRVENLVYTSVTYPQENAERRELTAGSRNEFLFDSCMNYFVRLRTLVSLSPKSKP